MREITLFSNSKIENGTLSRSLKSLEKKPFRIEDLAIKIDGK